MTVIKFNISEKGMPFGRQALEPLFINLFSSSSEK